jgi:hypothetical protein
MKPNKLTKLALVFILAATPVVASCNSDIGSGGVVRQEQEDCDFKNNASETADSFISRCREAGIRREFPGEYYSVTLGEIDRSTDARGKKARKLLTDKRWKK